MISNKKKYSSLITDIGLFAIGSLGSKLLLFLLIPLYTNALTNSEYGIADLVFTVGDLLLPFISLGIYNGLLRFGLVDKEREDAIRCATVVFLAGSIAVFLFMPAISLYKPVYEWRWFLAIKIVTSFAQNNALICLKIKNNNKLYAVLSIFQALLLVLFNFILLVNFKFGIKGYLISTIAASGITAIFAFIGGKVYQDLFRSHRNQVLLKQMVLYSIPFIVNDVSWWLIHSSDKIMIEWFLGSSLLGLYTAASKIPSLINAVTAIFGQAWGIASIKEYDSSNDSNFYTNVFRAYIICMYGFCIFFVAITKPFMSIYIGRDFIESWHYVPLLLLAATIASISSFLGSLFGAVKKSGRLMSTTMLSAFVNIIINYIFIQLCGIWGAVIGTVTAYFIVAIARLLMLKKYVRFIYPYNLLIPLTIVALIEAVLIGLNICVIPVAFCSVIIYLFLIRNDFHFIIHKMRSIYNKNK